METHRKGWGAFTLGSYIMGERGIKAEVGNALYMHEFGHIFDSRLFGLSYLFAIGLPSLISAAGDGNHNTFWTEIRANRWASKYFERFGVDWNKHEKRYPTR